MMSADKNRVNDELTIAVELGVFAKILDTARYSFHMAFPGFNPCVESRVVPNTNPYCIDVDYLLRCATAIIYRYEKFVTSDVGNGITNQRDMLAQYHDQYARLLNTPCIERKMAFYKAIKDSKCSLETAADGITLEWGESFDDNGVEKTINNIRKLSVDYRKIQGYDDLPEQLRQELDAITWADIVRYYAV